MFFGRSDNISGKKIGFQASRPQESLRSSVCNALLAFGVMLFMSEPFGAVEARQPTLLLPPGLAGQSSLESLSPPLQKPSGEDSLLQPPSTDRESPFSSEAPMLIETLGDRTEAGVPPGVLDSLGTLTERDRGFVHSIWEGSSLRRAVSLVKRLPVEPSLPTARGVLVRFLLTEAAPPKENQSAIKGLAWDGQLLQWRVKKLFDMRRYGDIEELFDRLPLSYQGRAVSVPSERDGAEAWSFGVVRAELILLARAYDDFCQAFLSPRPGQEEKAPALSSERLSRYRIFCHLYSGDVDKAMLGLDLLREAGADDPLFTQLALKMAGLESTINGESAGEVEALHLAMAERTQSPLPSSLFRRLNGDLKIRYASFDFLPPAERIAILEQVVLEASEVSDVSSGPYQMLVSLYKGVTLPENYRDLLLKGEGLPREQWHYRHAHLWNLVNLVQVPAAKAEFIKAAFDATESQGEKRLMSLLLAPQLASITPTDDLLWFAPTAGRALYVAGHWDAASKWLLLARKSVLSSGEAPTVLMELWPYSRLSGGGLVSRYGDLKGWSVAQSGRQDGLGEERVILLQGLFKGLGIDEDVLLRILDSHEGVGEGVGQALVPAACLFFALEAAREEHRLAETIALSLLLTEEERATEIHSLTYATVLEAFLSAGLEKEARQLAIEAAFLNGI